MNEGEKKDWCRRGINE